MVLQASSQDSAGILTVAAARIQSEKNPRLT